MLEIGSGDLGRIDGIIRSQWEGYDWAVSGLRGEVVCLVGWFPGKKLWMRCSEFGAMFGVAMLLVIATSL